MVAVRGRAAPRQLVLLRRQRPSAHRRGWHACGSPVGDGCRAAAGPRPLSRQPGGVLVAEPAHDARVPVVLVRGRPVRRRRPRRQRRRDGGRRVRLRRVRLRGRRRRVGIRLRPRRPQLHRQRRRRLWRRRRLPAVAEPHAHAPQPVAVPSAEQPPAQPATVVHQRSGSGPVQPAFRHAQEATPTVARRQEPRHAVLRVIPVRAHVPRSPSRRQTVPFPRSRSAGCTHRVIEPKLPHILCQPSPILKPKENTMKLLLGLKCRNRVDKYSMKLRRYGVCLKSEKLTATANNSTVDNFGIYHESHVHQNSVGDHLNFRP